MNEARRAKVEHGIDEVGGSFRVDGAHGRVIRLVERDQGRAMKHTCHTFEGRLEGVRVRDVPFDPMKSGQAVWKRIAHRLVRRDRGWTWGGEGRGRFGLSLGVSPPRASLQFPLHP